MTSNNENGNEKDNELSQLYQSADKPEPSSQLNQKIVAAAKAKLDEQTIINKNNHMW